MHMLLTMVIRRVQLFGLDKKKPIDYNQERSAKAIVDFALREAKNAVYKRMGGGGSSSSGGSSNGGGKLHERLK